MALVLKDRVQEVTNTTGTGTLTLAGAVTGFQSFAAVGDGNTTYYAITGGSQWELGIGTYTASGTTLSRDTVLSSSNSGNLVDFAAGSKTVFVTYPTSRVVIADGTSIAAANSSILPVASGGTGSATATFSGANITSLNASAISTGTIANARTTASSANGASTIVSRGASGEFAAGVIEFAAGTASAPSITTTGDTNTGIFFPAADTIAFTEGGAEAARFDSSGRLLIGTTSGTRKLTVYENAAQVDISIVSSTTGLAIIQMGDTAADNQGQIIYRNNGDSMEFAVNGAERMRIDSSGNVGIGTSSPAVRLHLTSGSNEILRINSALDSASYLPTISFCNNNTQYAFINSGKNASNAAVGLVFGTDTTERARITSGGYFKASNNGTYEDATGTFHEFQQTANDLTLWVENSNANIATLGILFIDIARNTTNNTFYPLAYYNRGGTAYRFIVADSGNVTNTNGSYGTISDIKHKQDIVDAGSQWDDIKNLRFRKYRLKSEVELDPNAKPFLGLVAQEAELVSPGLIEEHRDTKQEKKTREVEKTREVTPAVLDDEGSEVTPAVTETYTETEEYTETVDLGTTTKSIKTSILYMKAVKALQEAQLRIETLEAQNAAFEARLAALENK